MNNIRFTCKYWDCECETDYIRPASVGSCSLCGAVRREQPDSMVHEVVAAGIVIPATLVNDDRDNVPGALLRPSVMVDTDADGVTMYYDTNDDVFCCCDNTTVNNGRFADRSYDLQGSDVLLVCLVQGRYIRWIVDGRKDFESLSESEQRAVEFFGLEFK